MTHTSKPRVLLADDHGILVAGVRKLIDDRCDIVGTVADGRALLEAASRLQPDLIILDISMPLLNGLEAARQLQKISPETKLLFLTMHASARYATEAFKVGGSGFLLKQTADEELPQAITAVLQGKQYLTPSITKPVIERILQAKAAPEVTGDPATLTARQREVLQLIGEGKGTKEIATVLNISVKTVQFHKTCLMQELNLHTTAELMRYAISNGFADVQS
ncbi:MAG: response regulator transcription factor [Nitrospira sp.]|nr:response regulator transcription factor [Nitrospira sp.]